jgi:hypothetical protein
VTRDSAGPGRRCHCDPGGGPGDGHSSPSLKLAGTPGTVTVSCQWPSGEETSLSLQGLTRWHSEFTVNSAESEWTVGPVGSAGVHPSPMIRWSLALAWWCDRRTRTTVTRAPHRASIMIRVISKPGYHYDTIMTFWINYTHYDTQAIMTLFNDYYTYDIYNLKSPTIMTHYASDSPRRRWQLESLETWRLLLHLWHDYHHWQVITIKTFWIYYDTYVHY